MAGKRRGRGRRPEDYGRRIREPRTTMLTDFSLEDVLGGGGLGGGKTAKAGGGSFGRLAARTGGASGRVSIKGGTTAGGGPAPSVLPPGGGVPVGPVAPQPQTAILPPIYTPGPRPKPKGK